MAYNVQTKERKGKKTTSCYCGEASSWTQPPAQRVRSKHHSEELLQKEQHKSIRLRSIHRFSVIFIKTGKRKRVVAWENPSHTLKLYHFLLQIVLKAVEFHELNYRSESKEKIAFKGTLWQLVFDYRLNSLGIYSSLDCKAWHWPCKEITPS